MTRITVTYCGMDYVWNPYDNCFSKGATGGFVPPEFNTYLLESVYEELYQVADEKAPAKQEEDVYKHLNAILERVEALENGIENVVSEVGSMNVRELWANKGKVDATLNRIEGHLFSLERKFNAHTHGPVCQPE
jgi:hypothetical protein